MRRSRILARAVFGVVDVGDVEQQIRFEHSHPLWQRAQRERRSIRGLQCISRDWRRMDQVKDTQAQPTPLLGWHCSQRLNKALRLIVERDTRHGAIFQRQCDGWLGIAVDRRGERGDAPFDHGNGAGATGKRAEKASTVPSRLAVVVAHDICYMCIRLQTAAPSLVSAVYRRLSRNVKDTTHD